MKLNLLTLTLIAFFLIPSDFLAQGSVSDELVLDKGVFAHNGIDTIYRHFSEAYRKLDSEAVAKLYTDDALYLAPGADTIRGRAKILPIFSRFFSSVKNGGGSLAISFHIMERRVSGDLGYDVGIYTLTQKSANGQSQSSRGKFVVVPRRIMGSDWRFQLDTYSDLPNGPPSKQTSTVSSNSGPGRSLNGNKIVSLKNPPLLIEVDGELSHVGILNFKLKEVAQVERYIYASHDDKRRIQRLFIAQFESILPGIKGGYNFQVTNPTRLGNQDYQSEIGIFNFAERIAASPKAEAEYTKALLDKNNLKADDDFLIARYARVTDQDKRTELILFYLESLKEMGLSRAELESSGSRSPQTEKLFREFSERAVKSFTLIDRNN